MKIFRGRYFIAFSPDWELPVWWVYFFWFWVELFCLSISVRVLVDGARLDAFRGTWFSDLCAWLAGGCCADWKSDLKNLYLSLSNFELTDAPLIFAFAWTSFSGICPMGVAVNSVWCAVNSLLTRRDDWKSTTLSGKNPGIFLICFNIDSRWK